MSVEHDDILREIQQLRSDLRDDFAQIREDLASRVLREVHDSEMRAMSARIDTLRERIKTSEDGRAATRRWLLGAITAPIGVLLIQLLVTVIRL